MKRIGILTSGGDCQGLNASIRGVAKSLYEEFGDNVEIYGIKDGYKGLIFGEYKLMKPEDFSGILTLGGTILGTSRQPFKLMRVIDENSVDKVKNMKDNYRKMNLDCLVILGGNGTQKTANLLREEGLNVVSLPKTIDNDVWGTDMTFGFHSSVEIATNVIDCIHTTATSHGRIFCVEIMGHKVGWLPLYAGIAGGADVILIPEIPYDIDKVAKTLNNRIAKGKKFSILAVAEGALSKEEAAMKKKDFKKARADMKHPSIVYRIADELSTRVDNEIRVCVPGHFRRQPVRLRPRALHALRRGGRKADPRQKLRQYGRPCQRQDRPRAAQRGRRPAQDRSGRLRGGPRGQGDRHFLRRLKHSGKFRERLYLK